MKILLTYRADGVRSAGIILQEPQNDLLKWIANTPGADGRRSDPISKTDYNAVIIDQAKAVYTSYSNVGASSSNNPPVLSFSGRGLMGSPTYAGIFASHRNGSTANTYKFGYFQMFH